MIFGQTDAQKSARLYKYAVEGKPEFAWLPKPLEDGSWAWLQKVWRYPVIRERYEGTYEQCHVEGLTIVMAWNLYETKQHASDMKAKIFGVTKDVF